LVVEICQFLQTLNDDSHDEIFHEKNDSHDDEIEIKSDDSE
jgi:hypothetical protein